MIYSAHSKSLALSGRPMSLEIGESAAREKLSRLPDPCPTAALATPLPAGDGMPIDLELAALVVSRIEARVPGRIRHLKVESSQNAVVLTGECSTFYSKQVAQHAAMGVLEYEQLINNIYVRTAK